MKVILDTDVLIDCLRGTAEADTWLSATSSDDFIVPGIVAMELVVGCRNNADLKRTQRFLQSFTVVWPESNDMMRAYDLLASHRLASGLSIPDCIVAAMAIERTYRLYTFNAKHLSAVQGVDIQEPYQRKIA